MLSLKQRQQLKQYKLCENKDKQDKKKQEKEKTIYFKIFKRK